MLLQILKGTPTWVFVLFFALLAIGLLQTRSRSVSTGRLSVLPAAFMAFSLYGVIAAFGPSASNLLAWAAGIGTAVIVGRSLKQPLGARWDASSATFHVPGSWAPLALMMTVFFARYAIAASIAIRPGLAREELFALGASLAYGLLSGAFLARAVRILALRPARPGHSVQSA
jgi:hypothetical protein